MLAFTGRYFAGNPAGVCVLDEWLPDGLMQKIAAENNLPETAFIIKRDKDFDLRWMTPTVEGLRAQPKTVLNGREYLAVFEREDAVAAINPDFEVLKELDSQGEL